MNSQLPIPATMPVTCCCASHHDGLLSLWNGESRVNLLPLKKKKKPPHTLESVY